MGQGRGLDTPRTGLPQAAFDGVGQPHTHRVGSRRACRQGLTNPQVGERLLISRGTVKVHLSHIYAKLALRNRSELAVAFARRSATE